MRKAQLNPTSKVTIKSPPKWRAGQTVLNTTVNMILSNDVDNQQVTLIKLNSSGLILIPNPLGYDQNNITVTHKAIDPRSGEYDLSR